MNIFKIIKKWEKLPFDKRSSLTATWIQTISVVLGIIIALHQLYEAQDSEKYNKSKLAYELVGSYFYGQGKNQDYRKLFDFYLALSTYGSPKENVAKLSQKEFFSKFPYTDIDQASEKVINHYNKMIDCINADVCEKKIITNFLCNESKLFLTQIKIIRSHEKSKNILTRYMVMQSYIEAAMENNSKLCSN